MKTIFVKNKPFGALGITFGQTVFIHKDSFDKMTKEQQVKLLNHERIHTLQYKELGFFKFLWKYWMFYREARKHLKEALGDGYPKDKLKYRAYMIIPFEREAYRHEDNVLYPKTRAPYAWEQYVATKD